MAVALQTSRCGVNDVWLPWGEDIYMIDSELWCSTLAVGLFWNEAGGEGVLQSLQRYLYELVILGMPLHTSFPTLDRVALPERTSSTAELLRSTFPMMLSVLQDSAAIAKLSGRKTQSFPIFFLSQLPESTHSLKCIYLKYELCIYGKEAGFSKCPVYFSSLICWTTNLIHWSGFMQTLLSISFCTKSWCIMYRVWKWIKLHLEMVCGFFFFF